MNGPARSAAQNYLDNMERLGASGTARPLVYIDPADHEDIDHAGQFMICDLCKVPLNRLTVLEPDGQQHDDEVTWLHAHGWNSYDHDPVPIAAKREDGTSACDFCGVVGQLDWVYHTARMRIGGGGSVNDYGERWSACEHCSPLVLRAHEAGDYNELLKRVMRVAPSALSTPTGLERRARAESYLDLWYRLLPTIHRREYVGPRREPARLNAKMMPKLRLGLMKFWTAAAADFDGDENLHTPLSTPIPGVHVGEEDIFTVRYPAGDRVPPEVWRNHCHHLVAGIGVADMYWISNNFTRLAIMAGKDLDKISIRREDLPSKFGFMMFAEAIGQIDRPGGRAHIRGLTWTLVPQGVWMNLYIQGEDGLPEADVIQLRAKFGWLVCLNGGSGLRFGDEIEISPELKQGDFAFMFTILATWYLMAQPGVADSTAAPVDKKLARSYQREHNKKLPDVQLVDLRKQPRRIKPAGEHVGRPLTVRVFRSGHWKHQPYGPKRGLRKMIYISEYIAGPEGAPLKERRPVVKVVR